MINKINLLKKIAKFERFTWHPEVDDFSKVNIVFGYNASGKTAISNVFRLFSKQIDNQSDLLFQELSDDSSSIAEITFNGTKIKYGKNIDKKDIYVFNSDFIADHVYDGTIANIKEFDSSVVTQEQLKNPKISQLENKIDKLEKDNKSKNTKKKLLDDNFIEMRDELSRELNDQISGTRFHSVNIPDMAITKKEDKVCIQLNGVFSDYKMSGKQEELKNDITKLKDLKFDTIKINLDSSKASIVKDISEISRKKVEKKLENLAAVKFKRFSLNEWFEDGLALLKDDSVQKNKICPLCNSNIKNDLDNIINDYDAYFSNEYITLIESLDSHMLTIGDDEDILKTNTVNLDTFKTYSSKYASEEKEAEPICVLDKQDILKSLTKLKKQLIQKKKDVSIKKIDTKFIEDFEKHITNYNNAVDKIEKKHKKLLDKLENRSYDPHSLIRDARDLCRDLLYIKFNSYNKGNQIDNYKQLVKDIEFNNKRISALSVEKREIVASLKNESRFINGYLKRLGVYNFTVDINKDKPEENIQIQYKTGHIKNKLRHSLSEGEKTALAFAYFISKIKYEILDNSQTEIRENIVVIDDPISSLDENRLYSTACLINEIFSDAKQLFILSHNIIFLKFIGNLIGYPRIEIIKNNKSEKISCRRDYFLSMAGQLTLLPYALSNYKTVYFQKLDDILKYHQGKVSYDDAKIYIPNHIRVTLETFLSFKFFLLKQGSGSDKFRSPGLDKIIKVLKSKTHLFRDYPKCKNVDKDTFLQKLEQIRRITNPQSHGTPQNIDEFNFISETELKGVASDTLDIICFIDKIHYDEIFNMST
jgi:wobble nucleotide-excising tRNase